MLRKRDSFDTFRCIGHMDLEHMRNIVNIAPNHMLTVFNLLSLSDDIVLLCLSFSYCG